ncbi:HD domain-containing phosphohydrolase [Clostridium saccharoperbutylacetonicum]|uniref:sensor domain-containing diguanylate cyclase/phosphohydrolase n=1 Tax=Clostridium saccharoperbutylacetonicum TaxID=36745 RepID=UPI0039E8945B
MKIFNFDVTKILEYYSTYLKKLHFRNKFDINNLTLSITYIFFLSLIIFPTYYYIITAFFFPNKSLTLAANMITSSLFVFIALLISYFFINKRILELLKLKNELQASNILLESVLESSQELMFFSLDKDYRYIAFNDIYKEFIFLLYKEEIEIGTNIFDVIKNDTNKEGIKSDFDKIFNGESFTTINKYSNSYWQSYYSPLTSKKNSIVGLTSFALNITTLKENENRSLFLSYHDELTGLYNRRFYEENLKHMDIKNNYPISIIVSDVNGLKFTNDIFGHVAGDELIRTFGEILQMFCKEEAVIARIGGDEFHIVLPNTNFLQSKQLIDNINDYIQNNPIEKSVLSASFGTATKYNSYKTLNKICNNADNSMYSQKLLNRDIFESKLLNYLTSTLNDNSSVQHFHGKEVSLLCKKLGFALGLSTNQIRKLELAGLFHDVGKIAINCDILSKPNQLTISELNEIKRHSEIGYKILNYLNEYRNIANYVLYHHERVDGFGYPQGLKGNKIPFFSRIIHVAEAYHSMTTDTIYRNALDIDDAINELKQNAGSQFDAYITRTFIEKVLYVNWD